MKNIELQRQILLKLGLIQRGIGVHIEDGGVRGAEVRRKVGGFELIKAIHEVFPQEIEEMSAEDKARAVFETTAKCMKALGVKSGHVCSSPPSSQVVTRYFQIPVVDKKERPQAIRFEGARFVPFRLDETVFDYHENETTDKDKLSVTFNAIRINVLKEHVRAVESQGAKVLDTEPAFYSLIRSVQSLINWTGPVLLVEISLNGHVLLCLLNNKTLYISRDFFIQAADPNGKQKFFLELRSSMDYFEKLTSLTEFSQVLIAGEGDLPAWKQEIEAFLAVGSKVEIAAFPSHKDLALTSSSAYMVPIGLALRILGTACVVGEIGLMSRGTVARERQAARNWTAISILSILVLGVFFYFGYFMPQLGSLKKQLDRSRARAMSLAAELPEFATQNATQLETKTNDIKTKTRLIESFRSSKSLLSDKMKVFATTLPQFIWFSSFGYDEAIVGSQLESGGRKLSVQGFVYFREIPEEELRQVNDYAELLKRTPEYMAGFTQLKLEGVERTTIRNRSFTKFSIHSSK